ncbi:protein SPT2 homolog [Acropora muricata]|uniref:protein SPT2 homolog n=1 Tax=Acropora muricata TaxID=159855 RepID=UPI0034E44FB7
MDFKQLMDLAAQNKDSRKRQDIKAVTGKNSESKSSKSGVSDDAVKAFLAKKELEKKKKAAEEEAARRARIEERLALSVGAKTKESGKGPTGSQTGVKPSTSVSKSKNENHEDIKNIKQKEFKHGNTRATQPNTTQKPDTSRKKNFDSKNLDSQVKKSIHKGKGKTKAAGPMDFKSLLAMAEKNKSGGGRVLEQESRVKNEQNKGQDREKPGQKDRRLLNGPRKTLVDRTSNGQVNLKGVTKLKERDTGKALTSKDDSKSKQVCKRPGPSMNGIKDKGMERKVSSTRVPSGNLGKLNQGVIKHPGKDRRILSKGAIGIERDRGMLKRKRRPYMDMDDIDGDDDFIDDGEVEQEVDISKCIKEIFGYDRSRFRDDDDDLADMESNFRQIEREELKSSKIARLEDEIEQLKELHELKKQRDQLKKKAKK